MLASLIAETDLVSRLIDQAPSAAVGVIITILFLKHLREERQAREVEAAARTAALLTLGDACHDNQKEQQQAYKRLSDEMRQALVDNGKVMGDFSAAYKDLKAMIEQRRPRKPGNDN